MPAANFGIIPPDRVAMVVLHLQDGQEMVEKCAMTGAVNAWSRGNRSRQRTAETVREDFHRLMALPRPGG